MRSNHIAIVLTFAAGAVLAGCEASRTTSTVPEAGRMAAERPVHPVEAEEAAPPPPEDPARAFMAEMDALPPEERVPGWQNVRAMMMRQPPQVGEVAPSFELPTPTGDKTVSLSEFRRNRPVVLIFGSWT